MTLRSCAAIVALVAGVCATAAQARPPGLTVNGLTVNGLTVNGLTVNGLTVNGLTTNGLTVNGGSLNGREINGREINGATAVKAQLKAVILPDGSVVTLN